MIKSHRRLRKVKVSVYDRLYKKHRKLTYHTYSRVRRGDRVRILEGMFAGEHGTVIRGFSFWRGYTYEVEGVL